MNKKTFCTKSSCTQVPHDPQALVRLFATQCAQLVQGNPSEAGPIILKHLQLFSQKHFSQEQTPETTEEQFPLALLGSIEKLQGALDACYMWIQQAPHGTHCTAYSGEQRGSEDRCCCGKEALLQQLDTIEQLQYAPKNP